MHPPSLTIMRASHDKARCVSDELQQAFDDLSRKVEPERDPDEDRDEPDAQASLELATLGIELAKKKKEVFQLEREIIIQEREAGLIPLPTAAKRLQDTDRRYLSAGDELWGHKAKKARLDDPGAIRLLDPMSGGISDCLLALYKKSDGLEKTKKRPSPWRQDSLTYYSGRNPERDSSVWCHVLGTWVADSAVTAAHIVPFFLDSDGIGEILFGSRAPSLRRAGNALLLTSQIEKWFDSYHLVIVPADTQEVPIMRWRVDVISPDIRNSQFDTSVYVGKDLHEKELTFLNNKRPVSRFMYFHFLMALVRIKDIKRQGWQEVWAKYYQQKPFPTPGNYLRKSMLLALATHFGTADMATIDSWISDNGFDAPLKLTDDESAEAARRVHVAVEQAIARAERPAHSEEDDSEGDDSEEDDIGSVIEQ